jgi:thiosulfate/3-mercaptopyruvate sulfurtransferase
VRFHPRCIEWGGNAARRAAARLLFTFVIAAVLALISRVKPASGAPFAAADPWTSAELIQPQQLTAQLAGPSDSRPRVVCVGFKFLYESGHVPGSAFYGPGREAASLQALEAAAKEWPHDRDLVLYCGCCPLKQCPNVRPAFAALKAMGFTRLRLLDLETDFRTDWKGLPVEKSLPADQK